MSDAYENYYNRTRVISFFAKDLELKYAMCVTRNPKTGNVVKQPEVVFAYQDELIVFRKHQQIFRLLKVIGGMHGANASGRFHWTFREYNQFWQEAIGTFDFRALIERVFRYNADSFVDYVQIRGDEDGIHSTVVVMPHHWSSFERDRIKLSPTTEILTEMGYDLSAYKMKGLLKNQIPCKVACFSKDNSIIEIIIERNRTTVTHRYQSETGYTFMLNKPITYDKHINKLDFAIGSFRPMITVWELSAEKSIANYNNMLISASKQHPTGKLTFSDRNLLEKERMYHLINYTREFGDKIVY